MAKPNCCENFFGEKKKSVGKFPKNLFKMLFEGNDARLWRAKAGSV